MILAGSLPKPSGVSCGILKTKAFLSESSADPSSKKFFEYALGRDTGNGRECVTTHCEHIVLGDTARAVFRTDGLTSLSTKRQSKGSSFASMAHRLPDLYVMALVLLILVLSETSCTALS